MSRDASTLDAMRLVARLEGMITDPVYEGKSMAGLIDLVGRREIPATSTVLYAHLGGQPALNGYAGLFSQEIWVLRRRQGRSLRASARATDPR